MLIGKGFSFRAAAVFLIFLFISVIFFKDMLGARHALAYELGLPAPSSIIGVSDNHDMPYLRGICINPDKPLELEFIFDTSCGGKLTDEDKKQMIDYFLAALAMPENLFWINLSPYEQDRIMDDALARTCMGRDMMKADYLLKQLSSSLTHPDTPLGRDYWQVQSSKLKIESNEFNKIWILPEIAEIYEENNTVIVNKATLDVKTEADYLAMRNSRIDDSVNSAGPRLMNGQAVKKIIPVIKDEVNTGKYFAKLRQIYNAVILASWFKQKFAKTYYNQYINSRNINGIDSVELVLRDKVFSLYKESFEKGVYSKVGKRRHYISGGASLEVKETISAGSAPSGFKGEISDVELRVVSYDGNLRQREGKKIKSGGIAEFFYIQSSDGRNFVETDSALYEEADGYDMSRYSQKSIVNPRTFTLSDPVEAVGLLTLERVVADYCESAVNYVEITPAMPGYYSVTVYKISSGVDEKTDENKDPDLFRGAPVNPVSGRTTGHRKDLNLGFDPKAKSKNKTSSSAAERVVQGGIDLEGISNLITEALAPVEGPGFNEFTFLPGARIEYEIKGNHSFDRAESLFY